MAGTAGLTEEQQAESEFFDNFDLAAGDGTAGTAGTADQQNIEGNDGTAGMIADAGTAGDKPVQRAGESDEAYEQRWKSLQGIYRHEKTEWTNEKQQLLTKISDLEKQVTKPPEDDKNKKPDIISELLKSANLTDEQRKELEDYDQEFDIVSKYEGLKRKTEMTKLKAELLGTINTFKQEILTQFEPVANTVKKSAEDRELAEETAHFEAIGNAFPDYETWRDDGSVEAWIESKPSYMRDGLKWVVASGSTQQIIDLLSDFAKENNIPVAPTVVNINTKREERKKALTPPVTRRGAVNPATVVPNDFEGAFDEAIIKEQQKK